MPEHRQITISNSKVHYTLTGKGKCLVLIHGYGATGKIWDKIIPSILPGWQLVIPELPGSGISETIQPLSIKIFADIVQAILQQEKIADCIIIGHSMGGYVAMEFAKHYPEKVKGLGLLHSHVFADDENKKAARKKSAEFIQQHGTEVYLKEFVKNLFSANTAAQIVNAHWESIDKTPAAGLIADLYAMAERESTISVLENIEVPVLFGLGKQDTIMPMDVLLTQTPVPAVSQIEIFENSGHMSMLEEPVKCAESCNNFIRLCEALEA